MILNGAKSGKHAGMILIDLQKTFYTLDHKILLEKMKYIDFSDKTINWFHWHLTNRVFFRFIRHCLFGSRGHKLRSFPRIYIGIFVFLLYINDIPQTLSNTHTYLYTDKTSTYCQHKDVTEVENVLNKKFVNVCDWFVDNKLSIHFGEAKIKCIIFSRDKNLPEPWNYNTNRNNM